MALPKSARMRIAVPPPELLLDLMTIPGTMSTSSL